MAIKDEKHISVGYKGDDDYRIFLRSGNRTCHSRFFWLEGYISYTSRLAGKYKYQSSVCNQPPRLSLPDHPSIGRRRKLESEQARQITDDALALYICGLAVLARVWLRATEMEISDALWANVLGKSLYLLGSPTAVGCLNVYCWAFIFFFSLFFVNTFFSAVTQRTPI